MSSGLGISVIADIFAGSGFKLSDVCSSDSVSTFVTVTMFCNVFVICNHVIVTGYVLLGENSM